MNQNIKENNYKIGIKHSKVIRGPYQMSIDITNKCNLRCLHCYNFSGNNCVTEDEMSDEEFIALVKDVAAMQPLNVCICGGEPLLRKELLLKSIRILADANVGTSLVSNGLLLDKDTAKELKDSGLRQIQISLDGMKEAHERLRGKEGSFEKAVEAIKNVTDMKLITGIAFAPTRWNVDDFSQVYELARSMGVSEVRIQYMMEIGRGNENKDSVCPSYDQYRKLLRMIRQTRNMSRDVDSRTNVDWGDPIDHLIRYTEDEFACCTYCSIKADGSIVPSMYLPVSVGNVRKNSFSKYWESGLSRVWNLKLLRDLAMQVRSVSEMTNLDREKFPEVFKERDIEVDILSEVYCKEVAAHECK